MERLVLISEEELALRISKVKDLMRSASMSHMLICSNANLYYFTGRVYSGYLLICLDQEQPIYFVKRPVHLLDQHAAEIHKPENIKEHLDKAGISLSGTIGLELGHLPYNSVLRLMKALDAANVSDASQVMAMARSTKTPTQIEMIRISGVKQSEVYSRIPHLYSPGMTDIELQIEIERKSRLDGCLGQFRISGDDMEIFMGNVIAGDNADAPSPYDFAMGGAGMDPSLPVGANGSIIKPGHTVMVDMNGNYTGYMTDMTRTFCLGNISPLALELHNLSIAICAELAKMGRPGTPAKDLWERAMEMVKAQGAEDMFMGHRQHAGFVGHGVGIEINELPVIAPRSRQVLQVGNVIALEPKFVVPGTGAVGIENTYVVREDGDMEPLTLAPEKIIRLD